MRIGITREKALEHSSQHYSRWSSFQVKQRLWGSIIPVLVGYSEPEVLLERFMCETVLNNITISGLLLAAGVELEQSMKSRELQAQEILLQVAEELMGQDRLMHVRHAVGVAKHMAQSPDQHGDISLLARATKSSRKFAKKVLTAVKEGDEKSLLATKCRKDALSSSGWIPRLSSFFFSPEISLQPLARRAS